MPSRLVPSFDPANSQVGVLFHVLVSPFYRIGWGIYATGKLRTPEEIMLVKSKVIQRTLQDSYLIALIIP